MYKVQCTIGTLYYVQQDTKLWSVQSFREVRGSAPSRDIALVWCKITPLTYYWDCLFSMYTFLISVLEAHASWFNFKDNKQVKSNCYAVTFKEMLFQVNVNLHSLLCNGSLLELFNSDSHSCMLLTRKWQEHVSLSSSCSNSFCTMLWCKRCRWTLVHAPQLPRMSTYSHSCMLLTRKLQEHVSLPRFSCSNSCCTKLCCKRCRSTCLLRLLRKLQRQLKQ